MQLECEKDRGAETTLLRHKINTEDVQAVMVDFERVSFIEPIKQSTIDRYRKRFVDIASTNTFQPWFATYVGTRSCRNGCPIGQLRTIGRAAVKEKVEVCGVAGRL